MAELRLGWKLICAVALGSGFGCGAADSLHAYDVTQVTFDDCAQVGAGVVQCAEEEALRANRQEGRWYIEYLGTDTFALTTETGREVPGIYFENDGRLVSETCVGQGGRCLFARTRTDSIDDETGCLRIQERTLDLMVDEEGIRGQLGDAVFNDESCGTSNIRVVLTEIVGTRATEPILARGEVTP